MKTLKSFPLSCLTCVAIWILSLAPIGELPVTEAVQLSDKWAHFIMYGGFALTLWAEFMRRGDIRSWRSAATHIAWTLVLPVAMGGVLELLQAYATTYRSGEWLDMLANSLGAVMGNAVGAAALFVVKARR